MRIVITGAAGFIGRNLSLRLRESGQADLVEIDEGHSREDLEAGLASADLVFHLAGVNRPKDPVEFTAGNLQFTSDLCDMLARTGRRLPVVFTSSAQAVLDNPYGESKRGAETALLQYGQEQGAQVYLFRLPNVFGKWSRPNYNSAVATFCHNIARGMPIAVHDPAAPLRLVYIDDVVSAFLEVVRGTRPCEGLQEVTPVYETSVGEVAALLQAFWESRETLQPGPVGTGFHRALYATFVSFLPPEAFTYGVRRHVDPRGEFAEMLRTEDSGQFSYFTAHPGVTRGEHYHHSKTEKFLVIRGKARFSFRHMLTWETRDVWVEGGEGRVVETVPGWTHNVTNVGEDELIVMLWANERFDPNRPDTIPAKVDL